MAILFLPPDLPQSVPIAFLFPLAGIDPAPPFVRIGQGVSIEEGCLGGI